MAMLPWLQVSKMEPELWTAAHMKSTATMNEAV